MPFVASTILLRLRDQRLLTVADSVYAHAAVFSAITEADPAIGSALHDMRRNKRIALAIVEQPPETVLLRLSFIEQDGLAAAHLLLDRFMHNSTLRIGRSICDIIGMTIDKGAWSGVSTWADITATSQGQRLRFHFVTPTAIAKRGERSERYFSLFPEPLDVFAGLARRWQALEGPPLADNLIDFLRTGGCVTAKHNLRTIEFRTPERTQIGFVGSVVYECRKRSQSHLEALQALTRLAFFTGVGYQTARGMGLTQTSISE